jgi:hypothetical protein
MQAGLLGQDLLVPRRKKEAPPVGFFVLVLDAEDPGRRLLLEPLARVARMDAGRLRQLAGRRRATVSERAVETEPIAQVDAEEIEGRDRGLEEPLNKRIAGSSRMAGRH